MLFWFQHDQMLQLKEAKISNCRLTMDGVFLSAEGRVLSLEKAMACSIIQTHPEGLLNTPEGSELLDSETEIGLIVVDECHVIEEWYVVIFNTIL